MIQFQEISKAFPSGPVLSDASFRVQPGERIGLIGANGTGKSTVLNILTGEVSPDSGSVSLARNTQIAYVRQQILAADSGQTLLEYTRNAIPRLTKIEGAIHALEAELSDADTAALNTQLRELGELQSEFESLDGYQLNTRTEKILAGLSFAADDLSRPFAELSGGWRMRAELARALVTAADLLLLDEPTNYLDVPAIEWLKDYLRETTGTTIIVSHDRYLLNELTDITLEVMNGRIERYAGNYDAYVRARDQRRQQLMAAKKNQDRHIQQIERFVDRFRAKATKASQVQSRLKQLDRIERIDVPDYEYRGVQVRFPAPPRSGHKVLTLEEAGKTYDGHHWLFEDLELTIERGDKLAILGRNGLGKTTLMRILAGRLELDHGRRTAGHAVVIGYQSQEYPETLAPEATVWEIARRAPADAADGEVRSVLGAFGFSGGNIGKRVAVLSGGEKVRLALCALMLRAPNCLLLDEPTTHLDIPTREFLQDAVAAYQGTVCLISHDIEFIRSTATSILEITPSGVQKYHGDYNYYLRKDRSDSEAGAPQDPDTDADRERRGPARKAEKRRAAERRQKLYRSRKPLEGRIATCERRIDELHAEQAVLLEAVSYSASPAPEIIDANQRLAAVAEEITSMTEAWERATDELETLLAEG